MNLAKTIGIVARRNRLSLGLTQHDAAERLNISVEFYGRIERGQLLPSVATFARLVSVLALPSHECFGGQPGPVPTPRSPEDSPQVRALLRRLRRATPAQLRIVRAALAAVQGDENGQEAN